MPYAWIAFYEQGQFIREFTQARPPEEVPDPAGGRPLRLTSVQLYDHSGRAFIEQTFDHRQAPIVATLHVPSPERAGTVRCRVLGWQEAARGDDGQSVSVRHLAHIVEDGRVVMAPGPVAEATFLRPRRKLRPGVRPFTWAAIYDHIDRGPALYQFDPDTGVEASGEQIDRGRLRSLVLTDGAGDPWIEQVYEPGLRVVYRHRVEWPVAGPGPFSVFLLGWQRTVHNAGRNPFRLQHVSYTVKETGSTVMAGPFDEAHPMFHGIVEVPADRALVGGGAR